MENFLLKTERLIFRKMTEQDFTDIAEMLQNPNVMYAWEYIFDDMEVMDWIKRNKEYYKRYGFGYFLAIDKSSGTVIGQAALMPDIINNINYYEISYILKEKFWHKGYAMESAKGFIDYAFNVLGLESIIFEIRPGNKASIKVAEKCTAVLSGDFIKNVNGKNIKHLIYTLEKEKLEK